MSNDKELLELAEIRRVLDYDADTGIFTWNVSTSNCVAVGATAGNSCNSDGYLQICVNKKHYKAHRLAWFYTHGVWPDQIDHINGNRTDNRLVNLRNVSAQINTHNQRMPHRNNKSGFLGVSVRSDGKFQADIRVRGKKKHLGNFDDPSVAHKAYMDAKKQLHEGYIP